MNYYGKSIVVRFKVRIGTWGIKNIAKVQTILYEYVCSALVNAMRFLSN